MKEKMMQFLREEEGLTTVEYAVAGALISVAVIGAFRALGVKVDATIDTLTAVFT